MPWTRAIPSLWSLVSSTCLAAMDAMARCGVPDGKHTSSLSEAVLLLHTADPLLQDGGDLGRRGLCIGGVGSDGVGEGRGAGLGEKNRQYSVSAEGSSPSSQRSSPIPSAKLQRGANGIGIRFWELQAMAGRATGALPGGCDGLTEAILPVAEIAATRRLDWRMALENIAAVLKRLLR